MRKTNENEENAETFFLKTKNENDESWKQQKYQNTKMKKMINMMKLMQNRKSYSEIKKVVL